MVSVHIWLSIYTTNAILCIILGRMYALSIEVLKIEEKKTVYGLKFSKDFEKL